MEVIINQGLFDYTSYPKKLNLGCGFDKRPGFLNIDINSFHGPDLLCDITKLDPLPSSYYDYILAKDILEHIPRPKCLDTLREWNRVLIMGGILELQVPNVIGVLELLCRRKNQNYEMHQKLVQCLFGTQAYEGDYHYNGFTEITLRKLLADSGFNILAFEKKDIWLFNVISKKASHRERDGLMSIINDAEFIKAVYIALLKRDPDPKGMSFYLSQLESDTITREELIQSIKNSLEFKARINKNLLRRTLFKLRCLILRWARWLGARYN